MPADLAHAAIRDAYLERFPNTCYGSGDWRRYSAGCWPTVDELAVRREIQATAEVAIRNGLDVQFSNSLINSVHALLQAHSFVPSSRFDADTDLIVLNDCALRLSTQEVIEHSPAHYATAKVPYNYDPTARSAAWDKVLETLPDCHDFLQEFAALTTTPRTDFEIAVWLCGPPGCGKSTFITGLEAMLGDRCSPLGLEDIESSDFGLASLPGKTLVTATEQPASCMKAVPTLNKIISGEPTTVQRKYHDSYSIRPTAKILWAANELPRVTQKGGGPGLFRRIKIVQFPALPIEERNPRVKEEVLRAGMAVLNWTLPGYIRLTERGRFIIPASIAEATEEYRRENDTIQLFVDECCIVDTDKKVRAAQLYTAYAKWCKSNGFNTENSTNFGKHLTVLGFESHKISTIYRLGLELRPSAVDQALDDYSSEG